MKRVLILCAMLFLCPGCKESKTDWKAGSFRYDSATVIYPKEDGPWTGYGFFSIEPEIFTKQYKGYLKSMIIRDTAFMNKLAGSIESRDVIYKADTSKRPFDTFLMIKLHHNGIQNPDTLALGCNLLRFNQEVYADSNAIRMITDKIIKHDKDFAEDVRMYYEDGVWYPYIGKDPWRQE